MRAIVHSNFSRGGRKLTFEFEAMDGSSHKERSSVTQEALHNLEAIQYKVISVIYQFYCKKIMFCVLLFKVECIELFCVKRTRNQ